MLNLYRLYIIVCSLRTGNLYGKSSCLYAYQVCNMVFVPGGSGRNRIIQRSLTYVLPNLVVLDFASLPDSEQSFLCTKSELRECSAAGGWGSFTHTKSE